MDDSRSVRAGVKPTLGKLQSWKGAVSVMLQRLIDSVWVVKAASLEKGDFMRGGIDGDAVFLRMRGVLEELQFVDECPSLPQSWVSSLAHCACLVMDQMIVWV